MNVKLDTHLLELEEFIFLSYKRLPNKQNILDICKTTSKMASSCYTFESLFNILTSDADLLIDFKNISEWFTSLDMNGILNSYILGHLIEFCDESDFLSKDARIHFNWYSKKLQTIICETNAQRESRKIRKVD